MLNLVLKRLLSPVSSVLDTFSHADLQTVAALSSVLDDAADFFHKFDQACRNMSQMLQFLRILRNKLTSLKVRRRCSQLAVRTEFYRV